MSVSASGSTRYLVIITASIGRTASGTTTDTGWESFAVGGASTVAATDQNSVSFTGPTGDNSQATFSTVVTTSSGSLTFTLMQKTTNNNAVTFANRMIQVLPLN